MRIDMRLEGFRDMERTLARMKTATAKATVRRAMRRALEPVAEAARATAPVGEDGYNDGYLQRSIAVAQHLTKRQAREARLREASDVAYMFVGPSAPHAHLVEFGSGPRFQTSGRFVGSMPANPFMRAAWDGNRAEVLRILSEQMRTEIDKTVARAARRGARAAR